MESPCLFTRQRALTTVFVDTRLWKTKPPSKRFQNFRQSYTLSTDRIEIHQSQPASRTCRRSEGHTSGCNWWISIRSVDNTQDWRKFWKRFRGCFVFQSRVSTKTVVKWAIFTGCALKIQITFIHPVGNYFPQKNRVPLSNLFLLQICFLLDCS